MITVIRLVLIDSGTLVALVTRPLLQQSLLSLKACLAVRSYVKKLDRLVLQHWLCC
jgi:hypothetical protein